MTQEKFDEFEKSCEDNYILSDIWNNQYQTVISSTGTIHVMDSNDQKLAICQNVNTGQCVPGEPMTIDELNESQTCETCMRKLRNLVRDFQKNIGLCTDEQLDIIYNILN